jgi:hypothetical protein
MPGTGGIRKIRWSRPGMGKSGGTRVIYYYYNDTTPIYLLFAYPKGKQENLTENEKKSLRIFVEILKKELKTTGGRENERREATLFSGRDFKRPK